MKFIKFSTHISSILSAFAERATHSRASATHDMTFAKYSEVISTSKAHKRIKGIFAKIRRSIFAQTLVGGPEFIRLAVQKYGENADRNAVFFNKSATASTSSATNFTFGGKGS